MATTPKGLRQEGRALYRSVAEALDLNVIELDTLRRAAELADVAADLKADISERGLVNNSSVLRLVQVQKAIAALTKSITPKEPGTRHMSRAQRNRARDLARQGWG
jgi:hypothetical protein